MKDLLERRKELFTAREKQEAYYKAAETVKAYSDETIKRWIADIDSSPVYGGLLSAIVSTFNAQTYQFLKPAPADTTPAILRQISIQLTSLSVNPLFVNSTHQAYQEADTVTSSVPTAMIWVNAFWFSSLILSLSTASIGMMVKQWLNQYVSGLPPETSSPNAHESLESVRLRQYRLQNLEKWRVDLFVLAIPNLLQLALAFFLAGLLILVWTLNSIVAIIASTLVSLLAIATLATTVLPIFKSGCAYLSPQVFLFHGILHQLRYFLLGLLYDRLVSLYLAIHLERRHNLGPVVVFLRLVERVALRVTSWRIFSRDRRAPPRTWRAREKEAISALSEQLDVDVLVKAYDASLADFHILDAAAIWLSDAPEKTVVREFDRFHALAEKHLGRDPFWLVIAVEPSCLVLWWNIVLCALALEDATTVEPTYTLSESARDDLAGYLHKCLDRFGEGAAVRAGWSNNVLATLLGSCRPGNLQAGSRGRVVPSLCDSLLPHVLRLANVADRTVNLASWDAEYIALFVLELHQRLHSKISAQGMDNGDDLARALTDDVLSVVGLWTWIVTAPAASEEQRDTICAWPEDALRDFQAALGDMVQTTHLGFHKLERFLKSLREGHTHARPLVNIEFILAVRSFLSRAKSRSGPHDSIERRLLDRCESALQDLQSRYDPPSPVYEYGEVGAVYF
ncbi:hypothetical protein OH77DRAFT_1517867 [Trametes cingulata]|nr:hypothetical protein OH77DRAFT_1517867 [Trametes cingulata]